MVGAMGVEARSRSGLDADEVDQVPGLDVGHARVVLAQEADEPAGSGMLAAIAVLDLDRDEMMMMHHSLTST